MEYVACGIFSTPAGKFILNALDQGMTDRTLDKKTQALFETYCQALNIPTKNTITFSKIRSCRSFLPNEAERYVCMMDSIRGQFDVISKERKPQVPVRNLRSKKPLDTRTIISETTSVCSTFSRNILDG